MFFMESSEYVYKFPPLTRAGFVERPNRFTVVVAINGSREFAHLHDPGRLQELLLPGATLYLAKAANPERKTAWDIILVEKDKRLVMIYSTMANRLCRHLFEQRLFPGLTGWKLAKTEPRFGAGRFDFELARGDKRMLIEVKSVSLVEDGIARFPDAPTVRGARHLRELAAAIKKGYRSRVIFIVTRSDAHLMEPHIQRDPDFARELKLAVKTGVRCSAHLLHIKKDGIRLAHKVPIRIY